MRGAFVFKDAYFAALVPGSVPAMHSASGLQFEHQLAIPAPSGWLAWGS